jgi:hypothetical protein
VRTIGKSAASTYHRIPRDREMAREQPPPPAATKRSLTSGRFGTLGSLLFAYSEDRKGDIRVANSRISAASCKPTAMPDLTAYTMTQTQPRDPGGGLLGHVRRRTISLRAAAIYALSGIAKLNCIEPKRFFCGTSSPPSRTILSTESTSCCRGTSLRNFGPRKRSPLSGQKYQGAVAMLLLKFP